MILKQGSTGGDVSAWQSVLYKVGYTDIAIDGDFGPITDAYTKEYQTMLGLPADGIVTDTVLAVHKARNPDIAFEIDTTLENQNIQGKAPLGIFVWILGGAALAAIAWDFLSRKKK